ncbi:tRNA (adenine-N(6)-)-methyltransferase [[Ruminococcus] torques]|uniref:tRNA (adenine-N(6)-)-methyltransferase n=1 Tax=[Ruminococcus] torques TaxID=33039 RepID=UPI0020712B56|nr:MAG TPA: adenine-specific methyltransferase [Caudoviricetes sp.]
MNGQLFFKHLSGGGWQVERSSLEEGQNFFEFEPTEYDVIISNPPFTQKDAVLKRLYELGKPFAILLPLNSLQGVSRYKYFKQGIQILTFDKRIGFHNPENMKEYKKGSSFATAYFCKDVLPKDLIVEELKEYQKALKEEEK